jgi:phage FluMu protein Com
MARLTMRRIRDGEVPKGGGTAVQDDPDRPVFRGNGSNDYVCAECGNVLAAAMDPDYMDFKVRVKCGRCRTVNVADTDEAEDRERWRRRRSASDR